MGETGGQISDERLVIAVNGDVEPPRHVVFELGLIRNGLAVLAHISESPGEQVGVALLTEAENHRGAHIKGIALALEGTATAAWDQVALQHQGASSLGRQLAGGDQPADAGADHHGIPVLLIAHGLKTVDKTLEGRPDSRAMSMPQTVDRIDDARHGRTNSLAGCPQIQQQRCNSTNGEHCQCSEKFLKPNNFQRA